MYNQKSNQEIFHAALISGLGAGIVTSFAITQGQHPLLAIAITAIAGIFGAVCYKYNLI